MKKFLAILMSVAMVLTLVACGNTSVPKDDAPVVTSTEYPVTLVDMAGREVTIESEPQSIASGYYISSSALIALGLKDRVVAVETKSDKRPIYKLSAPELIGLPDLGSAKEFNLEACVASEPDLVILPMKQKETANTLAELGIPAIVVLPESHNQIVEMISLIGKACNTNESAAALIQYYTEKLTIVENLIKDATETPVVYMAGSSSYMATAPKDMYQAFLITAAGGKNAGDILEGNSWTQVDYEQILSMNPDIIVVPTNNFSTGSPDYTVEDVLADPQFSELTAVKNGAVYQMTTGFEAWDSPCPSGILGTLWMLHTIHPELYSAETFQNDVVDFYETFYGFTPSFTVAA